MDDAGHDTIRANGIRQHYRHAGSGPPVILLHGFPESGYAWRFQIPELARRYRVIAPDLRGYGETDKPSTGYDKRTMANDIVKLAEALGIGRFALIGHDRGARVATRLVKDHPALVDRLVVMDNVPTRVVAREMNAKIARQYWFFLFHQVADLPEALLAGREEIWLRHFFTDWCHDPQSINAFLINTGGKLVLIDSGAGSLYGDCCGHLVENLIAAGYRPEQIDEVYLTHLHADHVGGIAPHGKVAFPNAIVRVSQNDLDYWLDPKSEDQAAAFLKPMFEGDRASLKPYLDSGRVRPFQPGAELSPGIRAIPTFGHTPGHTSYEVTSGPHRLLVWGDLVHVAPIQFPDPAVTVTYDSDPLAAEARRMAEFSDAARTDTWIAAAHIAFPGLGHVRATDGRFEWIPANYTTVLRP